MTTISIGVFFVTLINTHDSLDLSLIHSAARSSMYILYNLCK
jgi:hypothetical protein